MNHQLLASARPVRPINNLWECCVAALVLLVTVPPLMGFWMFGLAELFEFLGDRVWRLNWLAIWATATGTTLVIGIAITTCRLHAGRAQPHHREYRDFRLMRHARHGPLIHPKRTDIDGLDVVSFDLHYLLSAHAVPSWWPVVLPKTGEDFATYRHPVFLCALPCQPAPFQLWSKTQTWDSSVSQRIIRGERRHVSAEFSKKFDLAGCQDAETLFADSGLQKLMIDNPGWNLQVKGDRLLAFQIPPRKTHGTPGSHTPMSDYCGVELVADFAQQIHRAH